MQILPVLYNINRLRFFGHAENDAIQREKFATTKQLK